MSLSKTKYRSFLPSLAGRERTLVWISAPRQEVAEALSREIELCLAAFATDSRTTHRLDTAAEPEHINTLWLGEALTIKDVISSKPPPIDVIPQVQALRYLGTEQQLIIFNAQDEFDVNAFAAICGTLVHGGFLILVTPSPQDWPYSCQHSSSRFGFPQSTSLKSHATPIATSNPQKEFRFAANESEQDTQTNRFMQRFTDLLCLNTQATTHPSHTEAVQRRALVRHRSRSLTTELSERPDYVDEKVTPASDEACSDQREVIDTLIDNFQKDRPSVSTLIADRGRGKSALLGMLAAEWLEISRQSTDETGFKQTLSNDSSTPTVIVTGPARRATDVLFKHLASTNHEKSSLSVEFVPPDKLIASNPATNLVIVDEAARLPLPQLKELIRRHSRIVLASTVHGYEGAGRGFALRLTRWLEREGYTHQQLKLTKPIRWLQGDALEHLCNELFLFKVALPDVSTSVKPEHCRVKDLSSSDLLENNSLLQTCFALLMQAHYRTRPVDLQHLLGDGNLSLKVLLHGDTPVALLWWALEGGFSDPSLRQDIVRLQRRPNGHVLPQLLSQWLGAEEILTKHYARIVRIAVHPKLQRRGFGSTLINILHSEFQTKNSNLTSPVRAIGAVFGADPDIVAFWKSVGFQPFHISAGTSGRSGMPSMAVITDMDSGDLDTTKYLQQAKALYNFNFASAIDNVPVFESDLRQDLHQYCKKESPEKLQTWTEDDYLDCGEQFIDLYLQGSRSFHNTRQFIISFLTRHTSRIAELPTGTLTDAQSHILLAAMDNGFSFVNYASKYNLSGKQRAEQFFKQALKGIVDLPVKKNTNN